MTTNKAARARSQELQTFYTDVLIMAVEGGIGYWSRALKYRWFLSSIEGGTAEPYTNGGDNAYATLIERNEDEDADNTAARHELTTDTIAHAFTVLQSGPVKHLHETYRDQYRQALRTRDAAELDAGAADNIVQIGLFGELVYA